MHTFDDEVIIDKAYGLGEVMARLPVAACADSLIMVGAYIDELLSGEKDIIDVLQKGDLLTKLYTSVNTVNRSAFLQSMAYARPSLRILQLSTGTGELTAVLIKDLLLPIGKLLYFKYTFTNTSSARFADAKKRFQKLDNIKYRMLDISKDLAEQGFKNSQYDLIVATNVIHATRNFSESLANINCILGFLDEWWVGEQDGRPDEPYVIPACWELELKRAGFVTLNVMLDSEEPYQLSAVMIAKPEVASLKPIGKTVTILSDNDGKNVDAMYQKLQSRGYTVDKCCFGDVLPKSQDVISLLNETGPFFENPSKHRFKILQNLLANLSDSGLFWVTRPSQMQCKDFRYAQVIGAIRSIRHEDLLDFASCEVYDLNMSLEHVVNVFAHFQKRQENKFFRPNYEYAIADDMINVPRIYPFTFADERQSGPAVEERVVLAAEKPVSNQVEVEVFYAGLSFKEVSEASGMSPYPAGGLGMSSSGRICGVGPEVKDFAVGDRVMCLGAGSFALHLITSEALCEKIPDSLSFEEAATIPVAYCTAMAALHNAGNLHPGQSAFIYCACGDIGLAALRLAKMSGAEIYATVSTEAEVEHLIKDFGLPRKRIFNLIDIGFVNGIMRETGGRGIDLALNSLSGELLQATWKCVAEFGKMVEIGTADLIGAGTLDLNPFLGSRSYTGVYLDTLVARKQPFVKRLLQSTAKFLKEDRIAPIAPRVIYEASAVEDAIRHVQQKEDMGKAILQMRDPDGVLKIGTSPVKVADDFNVDSTASYLLAGGLGGIGTVIARHLVENGARRLVCFSRNPGSRPEDFDTIRELESLGCEVRLVKGDMVNKDDVFRAVRQAPNLRGILHLPMLFQDEAFRLMKLEQWVKASDPKVKGAWYLLLRNGYSGVTEQEMIEAFRAAALYLVPKLDINTRSEPFTYRNTFATGFGSDKSLSHPDSRLHWKKDIRMAIWHNISDGAYGEAGTGGDGLKAFLAEAKSNPEAL
ncbi:hypothetical protein DL769_006674 [Monosporascus sp. CRB-8-3]|nr:hypothetical protein DL769_006674 [Monosporascus sp. CRB-8-3]